MGEEPVPKIELDTADFKFAAAYEVYSKAFDEAPGDEDRRRLNDILTRLSKNEISYPRFYGEMDQYREDAGGRGFRRARIQGQRKRAYRRDQVDRERSKRHKK